ncbi:hypothetical protein [Puia dinghuensis]|uniref:Uncharacterized protein n=1 Tax=Puia dinghuensis TaxID=1792502 RepID=A0A8J2UFN7_9BACT|nr:hypothetical protein [Puia dinghuensis]GGB10542.1 hypothetical protein GCM10011511_37650 [Puia dinghuensis]
MTDTNFIEVREGGKKYYLFCFFAILFIFSFGFIIPGQRKESIDFLFGKWNFAKLPFFLAFAFVPSLCLFYFFDKRVKVRIDSNGIWSRKYGNIGWNDIWYFNSTICKMRSDGDIYKLHVRLKDTEERLDKEATLKFRRMDRNFDEIRAVVEYYAGKYQIEDLGHESEV